jgi:hypothetical protein
MLQPGSFLLEPLDQVIAGAETNITQRLQMAPTPSPAYLAYLSQHPRQQLLFWNRVD